MRINSRDYIS